MKRIMMVFFFGLISTNLYAYHVSWGSAYQVNYNTKFYDVNGNEIISADYENNYPDITWGRNSDGADFTSINITLEDIASGYAQRCNDKTAACAEDIFNQANFMFSGSLNNYIVNVDHFVGTAQQDMYMEIETTVFGNAFFETDKPEWFNVTVINPLLKDVPIGLFNFIWDPVSDINRSFIAQGETWVSSDGHINDDGWYNAGLSDVALNDFIQFYLDEERPTPVSNIPLPASAWLFGSAFASLMGLSRRKLRR